MERVGAKAYRTAMNQKHGDIPHGAIRRSAMKASPAVGLLSVDIGEGIAGQDLK